MRVSRDTAALFLACFALIILFGCGGGSNPNPITVTLTTPGGVFSVDESNPTAMPPVAPMLVINAAVGNDTKNAGVCWEKGTTCGSGKGTTLTGTACAGVGTGSGQCGSLTNETPFSVVYTPPTNVTTSETITLTATSITDTTINKTATITVAVPPTFSSTSCNPPGVLPCVLPNGKNGVPYTETISFSGGVPPYTFGNTTLPPCLHLSTSSASGTGTISGTPCNPGTIESTTTFTVTVTDSGGAPSVSQAYTISLDPAPLLSITTTSLPPGFYDFPYNSSVVTQGGVAPLTFTFAGTLPPGLSANSSSGQITGIPTQQAGTYPKTYSFTVQVSDSALPSAQVQPKPPLPPLPLSITIQKPAPLQLTTTSLPMGSTATGYSAPLQATGGILPYTWTVTQGQLPAGLTLSSLSNGSGLISGTPVLMTSSTFTIQVADAEVDPITGKPNPMTATSSFTIVVMNGTANDSLLQGTYSFLFTGFDKDGTVAIAGAFTADGQGHITSGNEDVNRISGVATTLSLAGTYTIDNTGDGRGTLELIATAGQTTSTIDYNLVLDSEGNAHIFEDNSTTTTTDKGANALHTHGEGVVKLVVGSSFSAANFSGNYAFEFPGQDPSAKPAALAGKFNADGTGTVTHGVSDFNDAGSLTFQSIAGSFTFLSGNRGGLSLSFQPLNGKQQNLNFVFYFVSSSDVFVLEIDNVTATGLPTGFPRLAGEMILQNPGTTFGNTTLQGVSVVTGTALNAANSDILAGLLTSTTCDGSTPITFSYDENSAGTVTAPSFLGTCLVTSDGRAAFTGLGPTAATTHAAVAYLTGPGSGFLLGGDAGVTTGILEQQTGGSFTLASVVGGYTLSSPYTTDAQATNLLGQVVADGIGDFTLPSLANTGSLIDEIDPPATAAPHLAQMFAGVISSIASDGRGLLTSSAPVPTGFPTNMVLYVVSPGSVRLLPTDASNQHPELIFVDH